MWHCRMTLVATAAEFTPHAPSTAKLSTRVESITQIARATNKHPRRNSIKEFTMRKTLLLLSCIALALPAFSGSLADVTLPDTAAVGGKTLQLNGLGLRKKVFVKV